MGRTVTDWVGDFKLDGLPDEPRATEFSVEHPDHDSVRLPAQMDAAGKSVGVIALPTLRQPAVA